jgi:hypothetical protein
MRITATRWYWGRKVSTRACSGPHTYFPCADKMSQVSIDEPKTSNRERFELELEFVQALANPYYLHSLAQQGILNQPAFVNYLRYLLYWKEKEYARFVQCVHPTRLSVSSYCDRCFLSGILTLSITSSSFNTHSFVLKFRKTNGENS